jgi:hypothetical protein
MAMLIATAETKIGRLARELAATIGAESAARVLADAAASLSPFIRARDEPVSLADAA